MKPLSDQSHYEVLDILPDASVYEIQRAHKEVRSLYDERALASYAFFSAGEREAVLRRIDEAFATLSDTDRRAEYDRSIGRCSRDESGDEPSPLTITYGGADESASAAAAALREKVRRGLVNGKARRLFKRLEKAETVTGLDLKELRRAIGLEVPEIEAGTAIGAGLIPALEEDRIADLPSWLNLRNLLKEYADLLQANPEKIAGGYMKHLTSLE